VNDVQNENTDTLLLNHSHKNDCLNSAYNVESTAITQEHIKAIGWEYIHNVYELPSIDPTIRYLHAVVGFSTEPSQLKQFVRETTILGPKSMCTMLPTISLNLKKHKRVICKVIGREYAPLRWHLTI
jgi:hypothetical protein